MKKELVQTLTDTFEGHAQHTETGVEYWLARDIQHLLGYTKWENFLNVVNKAKTACEVSGHEINQEAWESLNSDTSRAFDKPKSGRIAVKVINHFGMR